MNNKDQRMYVNNLNWIFHLVMQDTVDELRTIWEMNDLRKK